jgi:hypothetical protein
MAETQDLDALSSKELHDRALQLARKHGDLKFLWRLLREIPAAEAATGDLDRSTTDQLHLISLLTDFTRSGEGDVADALRPLYIEYITEHSA